PEGIAYDSDFGHLYVVGRPETLVFHFSTTGTLLRTVSIAAAQADKPAGMDYAPSSASLSARSLYIVDRGVDNNDDPNENDGKLYEFSIPPISGNTLPTVTITAPASGSTFTQGSPVTFTGTASDAEDGNLTATVTWTSSINGALGTGGSVSTSTLSLGTHTITASVTDSDGAQASSAITVTVNAPQSGNVVLVRVAAGTDDAEESATGGVDLASSDLEMVFDVSDQTVGLRFNGVTVPRGATITRAYVQFQVDETTSIATSLTIQGQATDNAPTFAGSSGNISSRGRTTSAVAWSPPAWPVVGAAGADQQTPSLTSIVQEIVNRPGWNSGNSLVLIISGTGERVAEAYEGLPSAAPLLRVEFGTEPPGPNVAPTASNVTISGTPQVGRVLTGSYTYSDADGDAQGSSTYRWLRNGSTIGGASGLTYTLVTADEGAMIRFEVTPVAATGESPGTAVQSAAVGPVAAPTPNAAPTASNVAISGTTEVGRVLTGNYSYTDAEGDAEGVSGYRWLRNGTPISGATARTYTLVSADQDALIVFEVTPVAVTGTSPGTPVQSAAVGPVTAPPPNAAPVASNVAISGTPKVGQVLTGTYIYSDTEGDAQGTSMYRWFRNGTPIAGATARTHTLVAADQGAMIVFEVTPVAISGTSPGTAVQSAAVGPVEALPVVIVSSVSPSTVAAGTSVTMTITGSGFAPGARVIFENGTGGPTPTMTNVVVVNETTITGTFTSKKDGPKRNRFWDVRVTNTDTSTGALSRGLTITP
ncbi:MAG TPA: Ig-like domain-containing protein, partial [Gemmatimonadaceae bacterium]|nr:Ig-like domain-containing protein [Gemmatimonadaceae bacterium]